MEDIPFQLISSKEVYKNPWIEVREDQVIRPGGKTGIFGVVSMKPGATVLAVTPEQDIFLTKEYKYGISQYSLELVSGALDGEETPLEGAKRELDEELGYIASRWIDAGLLNPFTTIVNAPNHMFIALDLVETAQHLDEGEVLTFEKVPLTTAFQMVMAGEITHGASCVLILKAHYLLRQEGLI